jgi:hypothetical protein
MTTLKTDLQQIDKYAKFSIQGIKTICQQIGPRLAGSKQERESEELMSKVLKQYCDEVSIENF